MYLSDSEINRIVRSFPVFSVLAKEDWQQGSIIRKDLDSASRLDFSSKKRVEHAVFVLNGDVRIYQISDTGREVTLYRLSRGECCVLMMASILGETEYGASASIESSSEFFIVDAQKFKEWATRYEAISKYVFRLFMERMRRVTNLLEDITFKPIEFRLAKFLLDHSEDVYKEERTIKVTHEQIAVEIGTSREVVSRVLKAFEKDGFVRLGRGVLTIMNRHSLEEIRK